VVTINVFNTHAPLFVAHFGSSIGLNTKIILSHEFSKAKIKQNNGKNMGTLSRPKSTVIIIIYFNYNMV